MTSRSGATAASASTAARVPPRYGRGASVEMAAPLTACVIALAIGILRSAAGRGASSAALHIRVHV